jgi:hypothetical protein
MNIGVRKTFVMPDGQEVTLETGKLAKQAHGSAVIRVGGTMLLAAVVFLWNADHGFIAFLVAVGLVVGGGIIGSKYDEMFGRAQDLKKYPQCPY